MGLLDEFGFHNCGKIIDQRLIQTTPSMKEVSRCWISVRMKAISLRALSKMTLGSEALQRRQLGAMTIAKELSALPVASDAKSVLDTLPHRKRDLRNPKKNYQIPLQAIDRILDTGTPMPIHVRAHPEVRKPDRSTWTHDDWGNFIADRVAAKDWSGLSRAGLNVRSITVSAPTVLRDLLGPDQWYLSSHDGTPLPFTGLREAINNHRLRKYLSDRDAYRAQRKAPPKWYSNTMQFAARTADLQHMTIGQRAVAVRRIWDKGWHGGNRCKDKRLIPGSKPYHDAEACDLCGEPDSANHWHHH